MAAWEPRTWLPRRSLNGPAGAGSASKKIVLIDGEELAQLMIDHGVGVADVNHYVTKRVDQDYFEVE